MAGAGISFDLSDLARLDVALSGMLARADDLSPLMDQIGNAMETTTVERFESQSAPDGSAWTQSAAARARGGKTLVDDGFLKGSITHIFDAASTEIGSNLIYARPHNEGWAEGGIAKNQFLGIGDDDPETISELTRDYLIGSMVQ